MSEINQSVTPASGPVYYAQLNDNSIVVGISHLSSKVDKTNMILLSDYDVSLIGDLYNHETLAFTTQETVVDHGSKITIRAFSQRLNPVIRKAIRNSVDPIVIDIREDLKLASFVDLKDDDSITSLAYLVYLEIMTKAESDSVLNTPVTEYEV
jgi:hypothetical protein